MISVCSVLPDMMELCRECTCRSSSILPSDVGSCFKVLHVSFGCAVSSDFLVLDPRGGLGGLGWKVGSACEEFEDNEGGILG